MAKAASFKSAYVSFQFRTAEFSRDMSPDGRGHQTCVLVVVTTLITNANRMILRSIGMFVRLWNLIGLCADVLYLIQRKMSFTGNLTGVISALCTSNHFLDANLHL